MKVLHYTSESHITSTDDVARFFSCLIEDGINFHPDSSFKEYIDLENRPLFNDEQAEILGNLMDECFVICEKEGTDIYKIAFDLVQAQIDHAMRNMGSVSDGYHTFDELYEYRLLYNAAFFNMLPKDTVHKSKRHHTGEECFGGGWFIVMAQLPTGQVSNHYEMKDWDLFDVPEKEIADEWDGHTPAVAARRVREALPMLRNLLGNYKYDGYVVKDQCGTVSLFLHDKPWKQQSEVGQGEWTNDMWDGVALRREDFPFLLWEDDKPQRVKVTIELQCTR